MTVGEVLKIIAPTIRKKWKYAAMDHVGVWHYYAQKPTLTPYGWGIDEVQPHDQSILVTFGNAFDISCYDETPWRESLMCLDDYRTPIIKGKKYTEKSDRYRALEV